MKKNIYKGVFSVLAFGLPAVSSAAGPTIAFPPPNENPGSSIATSGGGAAVAAAACPTSVTSLSLLVNWVLCFMQSLMPLLFTAALIYFLYGAVMFIKAEDKARDEARNKILYGIVGLFVMVSVWGLVAVLSGTFNLSASVPTFPAYVQ